MSFDWIESASKGSKKVLPLIPGGAQESVVGAQVGVGLHPFNGLAIQVGGRPHREVNPRTPRFRDADLPPSLFYHFNDVT